MISLREQIRQIINDLRAEEDSGCISDAILAKIEESLPKEKRINCSDLNTNDEGYRKQGWNAYHTALQNLLKGE